MKTIEILSREHVWIRHMIDCLETFVGEAKALSRLSEAVYELLALFESFADGRHQDKEENVLFPELLAAADGRDRELMGRALSDHELERKYMSGIRINVFGAVHGEPGCVRAFLREAANYVDLHRAHMLREESILFPMVERLLSAEADERITSGFEEIEGGPDDPHAVEEQVRGLSQRIGLPVPPAA